MDWELVEVQEHACVYDGCFTAFDENGAPLIAVPGRIVEYNDAPTAVYLYDPPAQLRSHEKGRCLQLLKAGSSWFRLHWEKPAWDWETSRAYVEHVLAEAFEQPQTNLRDLVRR